MWNTSWLIWLIMLMGRDDSEPRPQMRLLFIPQVICGSGKPWWWWGQLGKTPDSSTRALWQSYQQRYLGASSGNRRMNENFASQHLRCFNGSSTFRKSLLHGTSGFTSHPNEGVLRIFIALKNPSPRPGLNPRPLGPVASTLTTIPSRRLRHDLLVFLIK
jgi:hypothetical protein